MIIIIRYITFIIREGFFMSGVGYIILSSVVSIIYLFLLTKLMGYRQLSELSMFDYIIGISIGSIAAEMSTNLESNFFYPLIAMSIYAIISIFLSFVSEKSYSARMVINGRPVFLIEEGRILDKNLRKSKIDISEFVTQCRINGYFDLSKIRYAILEGNGKISFMPYTEARALEVGDVTKEPSKEEVPINIVIDGKIIDRNLKAMGKNEKWLMKQLSENNVELHEVILATVDKQDECKIFKKSVRDNKEQYDL